MWSVTPKAATGVTTLIDRFKTYIATIIERRKGKPLRKAELSGDEDLAPTKRYKITKETELHHVKQSYLVTDSGAFLLQPGFLVGRGLSCHLTLDDPGSSRVHASFSLLGEGWLLKDNCSKNGTLVNGEPIGSTLLKTGDRIQIGQTVLVYEER